MRTRSLLQKSLFASPDPTGGVPALPTYATCGVGTVPDRLLQRHPWEMVSPSGLLMTRRAALVAAAGYSAAMAGCGRQFHSSASVDVVRVQDYFLRGLQSEISDRWQATGDAGVRIEFISIKPTNNAHTARPADVVDVPGVNPTLPPAAILQNYQPLGDYLRAMNADLSMWLPGAIEQFAISPGDFRGLPLLLSEVQFYVNTTILKKAGIVAAPTSADSLYAILTQANAKLATSNGLSRIVGLGWSDIRVWLAFVIGYGGTVSSRDFNAAIPATEKLVSLARLARWDPGTPYADGADAGLVTFLSAGGFGGQDSAGVFSFMPPWYALRYGEGWNAKAPPSKLPTSRFPTFPIKSLVPAYTSWGLGLTPHARHPTAAVRFIMWLYEKNQQQLLVSAGIPPVVKSRDLAASWHRIQATEESWMPKFYPQRYLNIEQALPSLHEYGSSGVAPLFSAAFRKMYDGADVASVLSQLAHEVGKQA